MKDFGDILSQWEKMSSHQTKTNKRVGKTKPKDREANPSGTSYDHILNEWLNNNEIPNKDMDIKPASFPQLSPKNMKIQDRIDLHNMTASEAMTALHNFILNAAATGLRKVLIVHGKGIHSANGAVLKDLVRKYIEESHLLGASGEAVKSDGGSGATWVIIRNKNSAMFLNNY